MLNFLKPTSQLSLRIWQVSILIFVIGGWQLAAADPKIAFFFGKPLGVWKGLACRRGGSEIHWYGM